MNRLKNTGLVLCGLVLGISLSAPAAQAVESLKAMLSANRIFVDGQEVQIEAYTIHDNNFMQLRDIGKAVGFMSIGTPIPKPSKSRQASPTPAKHRQKMKLPILLRSRRSHRLPAMQMP